jgi:adenylate kinase
MSEIEPGIVLLGCPGSGKGTQANVLCSKFGWAHLSTGNLFRAEAAAKSALGLKAADYMRRGLLVPDPIVVEVVAAKLASLPGGWLLDGFPRTLDQARELDAYLDRARRRVDVVLNLAMPIESVVMRMTGRRSCVSCKEVFNVVSRPPRTEGRCDACSGELVQREDDAEATVRKRLQVYEALTQPLESYYRAEGLLEGIDASKPVEEVARDIENVIGRRLGSLARK